MSQTTKTLLYIEAILVVLFIILFGAVTFDYIAFDKIKYVLYSVLLLNPIVSIKFLKLKEGKTMLKSNQKIFLTISIMMGIALPIG